MRYRARLGCKYLYLTLCLTSGFLVLPSAIASLYAIATAMLTFDFYLLSLGLGAFLLCFFMMYLTLASWSRFRAYFGEECMYHVRIISRAYPVSFIALDLNSECELDFLCDKMALDLLVPNTVWDLVCYENSRFVISMVADQWEE